VSVVVWHVRLRTAEYEEKTLARGGVLILKSRSLFTK